VVSDAAPDHARGRLIAFTQVMWMLGIIVVVFVGFTLSDTGMLGARLITGHLAVAALVTWHLRSRLELATGPDPAQDQVPTEKPAEQQGVALRNVWTRAALVPMLATFAFYVTWGLGANTMGQFTTYLLVTVSGASQSVATGINLACLPIGLLLTLAFVRIADGPRRDRLFYVATVLQIAAFAIASLTVGAIVGFLVFYLLYQLCYPFAGEANYKVWSQLTLPADTRGTTQGITYAVSRGVFAGVAFVTPALLDRSPSLLLWVITGCMALSALAGVYIVRVLVPRASPAATAPADLKVAQT
jgi:inositol transporter-like SP family MFS transporter